MENFPHDWARDMVETWLEGKTIHSAPAGYVDQVAPDHIGYQLWGTSDTTLQIQLSE
jgi:hypothetical protein